MLSVLAEGQAADLRSRRRTVDGTTYQAERSVKGAGLRVVEDPYGGGDEPGEGTGAADGWSSDEEEDERPEGMYQ